MQLLDRGKKKEVWNLYGARKEQDTSQREVPRLAAALLPFLCTWRLPHLQHLPATDAPAPRQLADLLRPTSFTTEWKLRSGLAGLACRARVGGVTKLV